MKVAKKNMFTIPTDNPTIEELIVRFARRGYRVEFSYNPLANAIFVYVVSGTTKLCISRMVDINTVEDIPGSLTLEMLNMWRELIKKEVL